MKKVHYKSDVPVRYRICRNGLLDSCGNVTERVSGVLTCAILVAGKKCIVFRFVDTFGKVFYFDAETETRDGRSVILAIASQPHLNGAVLAIQATPSAVVVSRVVGGRDVALPCCAMDADVDLRQLDSVINGSIVGDVITDYDEDDDRDLCELERL